MSEQIVLRTESKAKFLAVLNSYLDDYPPRARPKRIWSKKSPRQEIVAEFTQMDNATRTALAFVKEPTRPFASPC
jgi:hypothetical protein